MSSVAYSPDGRHIVSGTHDNTIRIWDAETDAAVGNPLEGHTNAVSSVAYSLNGRHIISGSYDQTIQIWNAETGAATGRPLEGDTTSVLCAAAYSPNGQHLVSGSSDNTICVGEPVSREPPPSCKPLRACFYSRPDSLGWVRDSDGGLLYWVPPDCRIGLHSLAVITIPFICDIRPVSLDFNEFAYGTAWTQIFNSA